MFGSDEGGAMAAPVWCRAAAGEPIHAVSGLQGLAAKGKNLRT
jgi:hypothetical protein